MNKTILAGLVAVIIASAASTARAQSPSRAPDINPHDLQYSDVVMDIPDYDEPFQRDGRLVPPARILQVRPGVDAAEVRSLLGEPLGAGDGSRGPEWDYNLKLDLADQDYIVCQYKVVFDEAVQQVRETSWRRYQCRLAFEGIAAAPVAPAPSPEQLDLSGDFLFDFDDGGLSAQGVAELDRLAARLSGSSSRMHVTGHTDRLGSRAYNQALSERRARSVAEHLANRGVPAGSITTSGRGLDEPVKDCPGTRSTPELRQCLAPNRRVSILVTPVD